ncbi:MAG: bifunctional L-myo-inositol-1-phosphate cytidylyltransferase/CDP-L-myo-inositol myo-inositolphosphotransferase [Aquificota bacterium]|nr:bifunctional L-myo-inositol-1-phosphate cytidylyltransferase/CDP-L-myo-inositol myo-inositolphosphotransferase [Aquificota bacterium]
MRTAVILCAGRGSRMNASIPKPLVRVAGREILSRTIELLRRHRIERFVIVVNPENKDRIEDLLRREGADYTLVVNERPERENGYSLYLAREHVTDREFVLTMGDHVYSEDFIARALKGKGLIVDDLALYVDRTEATRVLCGKGRVKDIGKGIEKFNGYDTGFFILTRSVFKVAEKLVSEREKVTVSDIVKAGRIRCTFVSGEFWTDVDTREDLERARKELVRASVKGVGDGVVSRLINRKVSLWISERVVDRITPMQATWATFITGLVSALIALFSPQMGGLIYQVSSMLDGVDGEIARASLRTTRFGGWIDSILDRVVDFAFLSALALWLGPGAGFLPWIFLALFGTLMVSYTTERFRGSYCEDAYEAVRPLRYLVGKRDERVFLVMVFCLLGWIEALFIVLALITNLRVILTVYLVWSHKGKYEQALR